MRRQCLEAYTRKFLRFLALKSAFWWILEMVLLWIMEKAKTPCLIGGIRHCSPNRSQNKWKQCCASLAHWEFKLVIFRCLRSCDNSRWTCSAWIKYIAHLSPICHELYLWLLTTYNNYLFTYKGIVSLQL